MYTIIHTFSALYMKCIVLLVVSCVFTKFLLQKHVLFFISHVFKNTHVSYFIHEMHILLLFSCVFTKPSLQKTCTQEHTFFKPYFIHEMHCFDSVFMCFHLVFTAETCTFGLFYMNTRIHMYRTLYMKCTVC
jgi:hypothetical protein